MEKLRIVFMGTPEFAVGILDTIIKNKYEVVGVITAPDKSSGRGQKIKYSAVKEYALSNDLPILQPLNLKDEDFLNELHSLKANLQVVVAFRMLPKIVWEMPKLGTFNLHASLLPKYRGAAPINWAIINGETKTGVTTFFIDDKIDNGEMILSSEIKIQPEEDAGELHDRLLNLGSQTVIDTLTIIEKGIVSTIIQNEDKELKTAPKLSKENTKIDWRKSGIEISNHIRGLSPYPGAWCFLENGQELEVKIFKAQFNNDKNDEPIGKILAGKKILKVAIKDGFLQILELQLPGKKRLTAAELLNGSIFRENAMVF